MRVFSWWLLLGFFSSGSFPKLLLYCYNDQVAGYENLGIIWEGTFV